MKEKRVFKRYTQSFKEEAVALITEQGYSVQQAADSLGIRSNMLYRWKQEHRNSGRPMNACLKMNVPS